MKHNIKILKAYELGMMGYTVKEIESSLMLTFNIKYPKAKEIAMKGFNMTMQIYEN